MNAQVPQWLLRLSKRRTSNGREGDERLTSDHEHVMENLRFARRRYASYIRVGERVGWRHPCRNPVSLSRTGGNE